MHRRFTETQQQHIQHVAVRHKFDLLGVKRALAFHPRDGSLLVGSRHLPVFDANHGKEIKRFDERELDVSHLRFDGAGQTFLCAYNTGEVVLWDWGAAEPRLTLLPGEFENCVNPNIHDCDLSPDGDRVVVVLMNGETATWNIPTRQRVWTIEESSYCISRFTPCGKEILFTDWSKQGRIHAVDVDEPTRTFNSKSSLSQPVCHPRSPYVLLSSWGVNAANYQTGESFKTYGDGHTKTTSLAMIGDGKLIVIGDESGRLSVIAIETGEFIVTLKPHGSSVDAIAANASGGMFASTGYNEPVVVWDVAQLMQACEFDLNELADNPFEDLDQQVRIGQKIAIQKGGFADSEGEVVGRDGEKFVVSLNIFGRNMEMRVAPEDIHDRATESRAAVLASLREKINIETETEIDEASKAFWREQLSAPPLDLAQEWDEFERLKATVENAAVENQHRRYEELTALSRSDDFIMNDGETLRSVLEERIEEWTPLRSSISCSIRDAFDRKQDGDGSLVEALERRRAEDERGEQRRLQSKYVAWRRDSFSTPEELQALRRKGRETTDALVQPMREKVLASHGLRLPDHLFTFWAFLQGLSQPEKDAVATHIRLTPSGVLDYFHESWRNPPLREGLDHRMYYRFYRDPPGFLSVLHGDTDGLHYGLWFDTPQDVGFVAGYYNNDGCDISSDGEQTLLELFRSEIESMVARGADYPEETDLDQRHIELCLLRDAIMQYETGDRPETGEEYETKYRSLFPNRIKCAGSPGVLVPQQFRDNLQRRDANEIATALRENNPIVESWVNDAMNQCESGNPASALALGHDMHWMSWVSDEETTRQRSATATKLLSAAYRQLGYDALAEITETHHKFRDIASVDVYERR